MFKFNFNSCSSLSDKEDDDDKEVEDDISSIEPLPPKRLPLEHTVNEKHYSRVENYTESEILQIGSKSRLRLVNVDEATAFLLSQKETLDSILTSDLNSGVYEGGLKVWECSKDLSEFIDSSERESFDGKRVLELGCGAGVPGLIALIKGASSVDFQDYNSEVIDAVTIPNTLFNYSGKSKFYSGDWSYLSSILTQGFYDIVITSETIYNQKNQESLLQLFSFVLHSRGVVYLASKTYYFGVGGSLETFKESLIRHGWTFETVFMTLSGIPREIIKIFKVLESIIK